MKTGKCKAQKSPKLCLLYSVDTEYLRFLLFCSHHILMHDGWTKDIYGHRSIMQGALMCLWGTHSLQWAKSSGQSQVKPNCVSIQRCDITIPLSWFKMSMTPSEMPDHDTNDTIKLSLSFFHISLIKEYCSSKSAFEICGDKCNSFGTI